MKMPQKEAGLFILLGTMLNEINMLHKLTYLVHKEGTSDVERKAHIAQSLFFQTLLVGKLWECWKALEAGFFGTLLSKKYEPKLDARGKASLQKIKRHFGKTPWISRVRSLFSFHYNYDRIVNQLERIPANEKLEIFLSEAQGNCLYYASSVLNAIDIAATIDAEDTGKGLNTYLSETLELVGDMLIFLNELVLAIATENLDLQLQEQEIPEPPSFGEIHMPFFLKEPE